MMVSIYLLIARRTLAVAFILAIIAPLAPAEEDIEPAIPLAEMAAHYCRTEGLTEPIAIKGVLRCVRTLVEEWPTASQPEMMARFTGRIELTTPGLIFPLVISLRNQHFKWNGPYRYNEPSGCEQHMPYEAGKEYVVSGQFHESISNALVGHRGMTHPAHFEFIDSVSPRLAADTMAEPIDLPTLLRDRCPSSVKVRVFGHLEGDASVCQPIRDPKLPTRGETVTRKYRPIPCVSDRARLSDDKIRLNIPVRIPDFSCKGIFGSALDCEGINASALYEVTGTLLQEPDGFIIETASFPKKYRRTRR